MNFFVSYTTRDREISIELLKAFSEYLNRYGVAFIDLLNNNSLDKQVRVFDELDKSNFLLLVESSEVYQSSWVIEELLRAKSKGIPIIKITVDELLFLIKSNESIMGLISKAK